MDFLSKRHDNFFFFWLLDQKLVILSPELIFYNNYFSGISWPKIMVLLKTSFKDLLAKDHGLKVRFSRTTRPKTRVFVTLVFIASKDFLSRIHIL